MLMQTAKTLIHNMSTKLINIYPWSAVGGNQDICEDAFVKRAENSHLSRPEKRKRLPPHWSFELKIFPLKIDKLTFRDISCL